MIMSLACDRWETAGDAPSIVSKESVESRRTTYPRPLRIHLSGKLRYLQEIMKRTMKFIAIVVTLSINPPR